MDESALQRTFGCEDRPAEMVVWVEWRLANHSGEGCVVCRGADAPPVINRLVLVRRDAHVILKQQTEVAEMIAGGL